jgi:hypothetical protein
MRHSDQKRATGGACTEKTASRKFHGCLPREQQKAPVRISSETGAFLPDVKKTALLPPHRFNTVMAKN